MSYDIIIGRDAADKKAFGDRGLIYLGKGFVKMGTYTSLSNKLWMDVARSHVVLIAGKRGAGKSYSLGVIAEELSNLPAENAQNIASVIFDTMGIFWTMKYENEKEKLLLNSWDLTTKKLLLNIIVPSGKSTEYAAKNIPFDATFELQASELNTEDWIALFNLEFTHPASILIERSLASLQEHQRTFALNDITKAIDADTQAKAETKEIAKALFAAANTWGIFSKKAEGMSVNVIIVAILALLVLVVLSFVFAGKIGDFVKGTKDCRSIGGTCEFSVCDDQLGYKQVTTASCFDTAGKPTGFACCLKVDTGVQE